MRKDLEATYATHRQALYTLALSITGCCALAEDAIHSAFERLCRKNASPSGDLASYVFASVRNAARDAVRSGQRSAKVHETIFNGFVPPTSDGANPEDNILTQERDHALRRAVEALDDIDTEIVVMKIYSELTFEAIGNVLNQPAGTVATRYRRALQKLETSLRDQL